MFETEVEFTLPCGYVDGTGALHRDGTMRRATAADEILPLGDPRVAKNPAYLLVILLSRVVTRLGSAVVVNPKTIENLYSADVAYLQNLYNTMNRLDDSARITCPQCSHTFEMESTAVGG